MFTFETLNNFKDKKLINRKQMYQIGRMQNALSPKEIFYGNLPVYGTIKCLILFLIFVYMLFNNEIFYNTDKVKFLIILSSLTYAFYYTTHILVALYFVANYRRRHDLNFFYLSFAFVMLGILAAYCHNIWFYAYGLGMGLSILFNFYLNFKVFSFSGFKWVRQNSKSWVSKVKNYLNNSSYLDFYAKIVIGIFFHLYLIIYIQLNECFTFTYPQFMSSNSVGFPFCIGLFICYFMYYYQRLNMEERVLNKCADMQIIDEDNVLNIMKYQEKEQKSYWYFVPAFLLIFSCWTLFFLFCFFYSIGSNLF